MTLIPVVKQPGSDAGIKSFSCLSCRQRKVKCDRHAPCSNCVKAEKSCSFIAPVRGKRKRTTCPKEGLHAKLERYEKLLRSYGAQLESPEYGNGTDSDPDTTSLVDTEMTEVTQTQSADRNDPYRLKESHPVLITKEGVSRYLDSALWSDVGYEFHPSAFDGHDGPTDGANVHEGDNLAEQNGLLLGNYPRIENLANLHIPVHVLPALQDAYADRIDPLMKVLHLPTFWRSLADVLQNPSNVSKSLEALVFSFYLATVSILEESECLSVLGNRKLLLYTRYRCAAHQALLNAGFLSTSSPMTLQAYALFMMGLRNHYRPDTLYMLSGVAVRLARKMGLHRDGSSLGLSPFETEMRRRLWWHLVQWDFKSADILGTRPSMDLFCCDTKIPLNVTDEDLIPDMVDPPPERKGITSVVVILIRCEIIEFLRRFSSPSAGEFSWELLSNHDSTTATKDSLISEAEDLLERKYLRYCDPSNSLHNLVSIMARASICKMKLVAHNHRRGADSGITISQSERDIVFTNASKLLEYGSMAPGNSQLAKYLWHTSASYLWNTLLYVLIEARHRKTGPQVEQTWQLVGVVFSKYPEILEKSGSAVNAAIRKWTLEVFDDYLIAMRDAKLPEPAIPEYITIMRRHSKPLIENMSKLNNQTAATHIETNPTSYSNVQTRKQDGNLPTDVEPLESYDFSNILSFEMNPNEWSQWEQLVADQGEFLPG